MTEPHLSFDATGNPVQPGPAGPPQPATMAQSPMVTTDSPPDKSVGAAVVLTVFFGPLGLFYSSVVGGLVMLALYFVIFLISVGTLGFGAILFLIAWPVSVIWGAVSASNTHREFEMWKVRMMMSAR